MGRPISLDVVRVAAPCHESWETMEGDERTRYCSGCQLHVHNLSAMPREEAERLLCESKGRLCVRYAVGADGAPVTLNYQMPGRVKGGWRRWTLVGALGGCAAAAAHVFFRSPPATAPVPPPVQSYSNSWTAGVIVMPAREDDGEDATPKAGELRANEGMEISSAAAVR